MFLPQYQSRGLPCSRGPALSGNRLVPPLFEALQRRLCGSSLCHLKSSRHIPWVMRISEVAVTVLSSTFHLVRAVLCSIDNSLACWLDLNSTIIAVAVPSTSLFLLEARGLSWIRELNTHTNTHAHIPTCWGKYDLFTVTGIVSKWFGMVIKVFIIGQNVLFGKRSRAFAFTIQISILKTISSLNFRSTAHACRSYWGTAYCIWNFISPMSKPVLFFLLFLFYSCRHPKASIPQRYRVSTKIQPVTAWVNFASGPWGFLRG